MFEKQLTDVLNAKLSKYLEGIDPEDVRVGVLNGDVCVRRVRVRGSALTKILDEPSVRVRHGFVDELRLRIPWRKLGKEPVSVLFKGIYVVAEIDENGTGVMDEEGEAEREERLGKKALRTARRAANAAERAWLKWNPAVDAEALEAQNKRELRLDIRRKRSGIAGVIDVVLANLAIEISHVHVRIEGSYGERHVPCGMGFTLERMTLSTVGENMEQTVFQVAGFADRLRKAIKLERMGVYADFNSPSVAANTPDGWKGISDDLFVRRMSSFMGANSSSSTASPASATAYILGPVQGLALYTRRGYNEADDRPLHEVRVDIQSIQGSIRSTQLKILYAMYSKLRVSRIRYAYSLIRPSVSVQGHTQEWWAFALKGVNMHIRELNKRRGLDFRSSVDALMRINRARERYVSLYVQHLCNAPPPPECYAHDRADQKNKNWPPSLREGELPEIDDIERHIPLQSVVTFRTLAHLEYRKSGLREAVARERKRRLGKNLVKKTVFGLAHGGAKNTASVLKVMANPIRGIVRAVKKKDSRELVLQQQRARVAQENTDSTWREDLGITMELDERSIALETKALSASVELSFMVYIEDASVSVIDDEMLETGTTVNSSSHREIVRLAINRIALGTLAGPGKTERQARVQSLAIVSPEGTLMKFSPTDQPMSSAQADLWTDATRDHALHLQIIRGDIDIEEDVAVKLYVASSKTIIIREPLDRVLQVAARNKVTSSYIGSFILEDEAMERNFAGSIEKQNHAFNVKPKIRLDATIENPVLIMAGEGSNLLIDLGRTSIKSVPPVSAGVDRALAQQHNAFCVHSTGVRAGFIDDDWSINSSESIVLPLLSMPTTNVTIVQSLHKAMESPNIMLMSNLSSLDVSFSPARLFKIKALKESLTSPQSHANVVETPPVARVKFARHDTEVRILQRDEVNGDLIWVPAKISMRQNKFLDIQVMDGLRSRDICVNVTESSGASKLRREVCDQLVMNDNVVIMSIGRAFKSIEELRNSFDSDDSITLAFDSASDKKTNSIDLWYGLINDIVRKNVATLVDSQRRQTSTKTQLLLKFAVERFSLSLLCPLLAHPSEDEKYSNSNLTERALVSACVELFSGEVAAASTRMQIGLKIGALKLMDDYSSVALGRECTAAICGTGSSKREAISLGITLLRQDDAHYIGIDKLIEVDIHEKLDLSVRRSTLLALCALRFTFRAPGFKPNVVMPDVAQRVMVSGELIKRIKREIRVNLASAIASAYFDHNCEQDIPVVTLQLDEVYWDTIISPPTRETVVSVGVLKLATGEMAMKGEWNLQPSHVSGTSLLLENSVYDRGEELDGADLSLNVELGGLDVIMTPEMREVGPFLSFFGAIRPNHIEKFVHPCNRPREGFTHLKIRMSIKVDSPKVMFAVPAIDNSGAQIFVIKPGNIEVSRSFASERIKEELSIFMQTTILKIDGLEALVMSQNGEKVSALMRKPLSAQVSLQKRIDSGPNVTNEIVDKIEVQIRPIFLDISGIDFRCAHDGLKEFFEVEVRENVVVMNPINWGRVGALPAKTRTPTTLRSMCAVVTLSSVQVSVYKHPLRVRPISTMKVVGVHIFALKNMNGKSGMELDVTLKMFGVDDDSQSIKHHNSTHLLYAGAQNCPFLRLTLREDDELRQLHAALQHVELFVKPGIMLDTVQTFAPRRMGGIYLPGMILPRDVYCTAGSTLNLKSSLPLTSSTRLLADDPHIAGGIYRVNGNGHVIKFFDKHGQPIYRHAEGQRRETIPRIIVGYKASLTFENVIFKCTRSALSRFIKLAPEASFALGFNVQFDDAEELELTVNNQSIVSKAAGASSKERGEGKDDPTVSKVKKRFLAEASVACVHIVLGAEFAKPDQLHILFGLAAHIEQNEHLGNSMTCELLRLRTKDTMKPPLLKPLAMTLQLESQNGESKCTGSVTPVAIELTPHRISILRRVIDNIARSFAIAPLLRCSVYSCVWDGSLTSGKEFAKELLVQSAEACNTSYTVWRPVAPSGYGVLADVIKSESGAPETEVWIARDTPAICTLPEKFEKVEGSEFPCFWRPIAPKGFISLGLIASSSADDEPPLDSVRCIRQELVTNLGEVSTRVNFDLYGERAQSALTLWQTNNVVAGFTCAKTERMRGDARPTAYDIRRPAGFQMRLFRKTVRDLKSTHSCLETSCTTVVDFKKVGIARNRDSVIGFWEAVLPAGYVSTGHCVSAGEIPPLHTRVFADDKNIFQPPQAFRMLVPSQSFGTRGQRLTIWRPVPPKGFLGVGVLVTSDDQEPSLEASIVCVRSDLVHLVSASKLTSNHAFWVNDENSSTPIYFWITNAKTHDFIASVMDKKSEVSPTFDFDVGCMGNASEFDPEFPKWQLKFEAPSVCVSMAFERVFQNQTLFICQLESTRVDHTKKSKSSHLSMETSFSIMHKNARVGNVLEPALAPWKLSFVLDNTINDVMNVAPASSNMLIYSQDECALMLNQALLIDVMDSLAQFKRPSEENAKAAKMRADTIMRSQVIINSTGRSLWVRKANGEVQEVPVGHDIAEALRNDELEEELDIAESEMRGRTDIIDEVNHRGAERLAIAYMSIDIIDILEIETVNKLLFPRLTFKIWDERLKKLRIYPLPVSTLSGSVQIQIPHPLLRGGNEMEYVHEDPVLVIVELSSLHPSGEVSSVQGSIKVSAEELRDDWIRDRNGFWVDCREGNGKPVRVLLRARVVEGLTRSPIMELNDVARILTSPRKKVASKKLSARPPLIVCRTNDLVKVWWTKGKHNAKKALSAWRPHRPSHSELAQRHTFFAGKSADAYELVPFGTILISGLNAPRSALMAVVMKYDVTERPATAFPADFEKIWEGDKNRISFWKPVAPQGYVAIGNVVVTGAEKPSTDCVVCIREDLSEVAPLPPSAAWKSNVQFKRIHKGRCNVIQNGDTSTGGWTFLKERLLRAKDGAITNNVPQMHKLNQALCIPALEDEGASEIWFDHSTHIDRMKLDLHTGESLLMIAFSPEGPFEQINLQLGSSHVVQHKTHDLVFDGLNGQLLSYINVENETQIQLIAEMQRLRGSQMLSSTRVLSLDEEDEVVEVFEAERYYPFRGWATPKDAVHFSNRFSTRRNGSRSTRFFPAVRPPKGYKFDGPWRLDIIPGLVDENGWAYRATPLTTWPPPPGSEKRKARSTRRRRWVRDLVRVKTLETFVDRASLHTIKRDSLNNWRGDLTIDGSITLPPVSRSDPYTLHLHRDGVDCSFAETFPVSRLSEQGDCSFSYTNGVDHFILVVQRAGTNKDSALGAVPITRLRVIAPFHVTSNVRCRSYVSIHADGESAFSDEVRVNETKRITTIDTGTTMEIYVTLFAENLVLYSDTPLLLEVTPAGTPSAPQCKWLSIKGYPHLTSPLLVDATRTRLSGNTNNDHPSQHLLSVSYRSMLVITNASSIGMKFLTRSGGTGAVTESRDNFVELPPGWTLPGMFVKSAVQKLDKFNVQEFILELCIDDASVRVNVSARSEPVMITLPTLSGDKLLFKCSAAIGHGSESTPWPTVEVIVQPALVAVNLTHLPLAIRAQKKGFTVVKPSSCPVPFSLDISSSLDAGGVETALNQTALEIADASFGETNMQWSAPLHNFVRFSGAFWSIPSRTNPSAADIDRFRLLPRTDKDDEPVNFIRPLVIQFVVERSEQGCFRIFFKGGNGSALHSAPVFIQNHIPKALMIRQVASQKYLNLLQGTNSKRTYSKSSSKMDIGMGQSFAICEHSCTSWAWSEPGMPFKLDTSIDANDSLRMCKLLEISAGTGETCIVKVKSQRSNFHGFMRLGELEFVDRQSGDTTRAIILGEWRAGAFFIFVVHATPAFDNFSYKQELVRQSATSDALVKRKESHLAVNLASFSLTIIDRFRTSYAELLRISIDDLEFERGAKLFAGRSSYHHVGIGALQIDFSEPGAKYPVFVWHDSSAGKLCEAFVTVSEGHSRDIVVHRFELITPRDGVVVRAGEELVWVLTDFLHSLRAQMPQPNTSAASVSKAAARTGRKKNRDARLYIEALSVEALSFMVTFDPNSDIRPNDANAKVVALLTFASLQGLRLTLERFERLNENTMRSNLISDFVKHIKSQMVSQTLSIMTSMQTLSNVSTGLDAMSKVVGSGFGVLHPMKIARQPSSLIRSRKRTKMRNNIAAGVFLGLRRFGQDVALGLIGLFVIPFRGAKEGGLVGACKGCAQGVANAVVKPVAGAISLAAKTVEGVANTARDVQTAAWEFVNASKVSKARVRRLPIAVRSDGIIRPWNASDAKGVYCMRMGVVSSASVLSYAPGISDNFVSMHDIPGNLLLIVTNNRCMAVENPAMDDSGVPVGPPMCRWYISWSDVSSVWITDFVVINVQFDTSSNDSNLGNQNESLMEHLSRFVIRSKSPSDAKEIETSMRRCWHALLRDTE